MNLKIFLRIALAGAAWTALAACRDADRAPAPPAPVEGALAVDLVAEFPAASVESESALIELGRPSARAYLISGWSDDEKEGDETFVWGVGESAAVSFYAALPTAFTLGLDCEPLVFPAAPEASLSLAVNGEPLGEVRLRRKRRRYEIAVPARIVAPGANRLDLGFAYHRRPRDVIAGAADGRSLAVRFFSIGLEGLGAGTLPEAAGSDVAGADRIPLPAGTAASYYFASASGAELVIPGIEAWGAGAGDVRLLVRFRSADEPEESTWRIDPAEAVFPLRLPLAADGPAIDRLQLAAVTVARGGMGAWIREKLGWSSRRGGLSLVLPAVRRLGSADGGGDLRTELPRPRVERANILIYLIDTLRADHLGAYGYPRPVSPNIDGLAADGVLFSSARAQSSWTRPAVASVLTGLLPQTHGVHGRADALPAEVDTLAEMLADQGYETVGLVTNGNVGPSFAFGQGFESFRHLRESAERVSRHWLSDHLNLWIFQWLEQRRDAERPFFLYAHATDPHVPYTPPEPFRARFAAAVDPAIGELDNVRPIMSGERAAPEGTRQGLIDLYDGEIAFNDHHFGRLIERLKELGLYRTTLIVLLSDHGEEFLDHGGWEHGKTLYGEQLRVPLILKLPGGLGAGTRVDGVANQVDVVPTILDLLGLEVPQVLDGRSLLAPLEKGGPASSYAYLGLSDRRVRSVERRGWKLILDDSPGPRGGAVQLFQVEVDRQEARQMAGEHLFERGYLAQALRRLALDLGSGSRFSTAEVEIPEELRRQLKALGYL